MKISTIGEIINNTFIYGNSYYPSFNSKCRLINKEELAIIFGNSSKLPITTNIYKPTPEPSSNNCDIANI